MNRQSQGVQCETRRIWVANGGTLGADQAEVAEQGGSESSAECARRTCCPQAKDRWNEVNTNLLTKWWNKANKKAGKSTVVG
eukprot:6208414-Pleurochrysis_carterae.AAC.1